MQWLHHKESVKTNYYKFNLINVDDARKIVNFPICKSKIKADVIKTTDLHLINFPVLTKTKKSISK